jgi:serine/threonine protein kinase
MELLQGLPLDEYLKAVRENQHTIPLETTTHLLIGLCAGLSYAHSQGIVHRDIKPANIILRRHAGPVNPQLPLPLDIEPIITDFGIARFKDLSITAPGSVTGTPAYFSPEQARGDKLDARTDIYSLGVILYEVLAGQPPFASPEDTLISIILKTVELAPPPIPGIDTQLQAVLDRVLEKDPGQRYQHAGELAAALFAAVYQLEAETGPSNLPLAGLLDTLDLLVNQAQTYQRALSPSNYQAHSALTSLSELAQQAYNEAKKLTESQLQPASEHALSPREHEVLTLAAKGLTNKEIAYRLGISERTVQFHMNSVFNKTTTSSRTEAVALALSQGWISTE